MPRPRLRGTKTTREAILAAAIDLLLANGYARTFMDAVAARAGVSKTTVYAHFSDKLQLFHAVMEQAASIFTLDLSQVMSSVSRASPERKLTALLIEVVKAASAPELTGYFRILISEIDQRDELKAIFERVEGGLPDVIRMIAPLIVDVAERRGYGVKNPEDYAALLLRLIAPGAQFDTLVSNFRPSAELLEAHIKLVIRIFFDGIGPKTGPAIVKLPGNYKYPWEAKF